MLNDVKRRGAVAFCFLAQVDGYLTPFRETYARDSSEITEQLRKIYRSPNADIDVYNIKRTENFS